MVSRLADNSVVWIAWQRHRRTEELCKFIGITPLIFLSRLPRLFKYPLLIIKTFKVLISQRPKVLIVQNPSIVLALITCLTKRYFGYKLIIDTHNAGILPDHRILNKFSFAYRYIQASADITIVTNKSLANCVASNKGHPLVLPDRIPVRQASSINYKPNDQFNVVFICTFGIDEPYMEVLKASLHLRKEGVHLYVTGNLSRLEKGVFDEYANKVTFTGFLPEDEYWELLENADLILDLTTRENCLVCGAYEAVAVKVPMILSDTAILRSYFFQGAIFTQNTSNEIVTNIRRAKSSISVLRHEVTDLRLELDKGWVTMGNELMRIIY